MRLEAHAKVNIGLLVGERRYDGFHDIETIMARISLCDLIEAEASPARSFSVHISGNDGYLSGGKDLMEKAAELYSAETGIPFSLDIRIRKHIPAMAGLGGGSSDAASVLLYLEDFFGNPLGHERLMKLAFSVGSDVPFFVSGYSGAVVTGRGEIVNECYVPHGAGLLLFFPPHGVSTASAYDLLDTIPRNARHLAPLSEAFPTRYTHPNDFELVSDSGIPFVLSVPMFLSNAYVSMTGSGSAWFALFPSDGFPKFDNPEKYDIVSAYII